MRNKLKILILSVTIIVAAVFGGLHSKDGQPFYGDGLGYYLYLPATFIYHNFDSIYQYPADADIPSFIKGYMGIMDGEALRPQGMPVIQYTYGVALMELPFFLMAHAYEKIAGLPADGYSGTYQLFIKLSTVFYVLAGLLLLYSVLKRFFSELHAVLAAALLFLGTNLFWFTLYQTGMSHEPLFFLNALLMYLTVRIHERPTVGRFLLMGLCLGMVALIRPTDVITILVPLLYGVYSYDTLKEKLRFIRRHFLKITLAGLFFVLPLIPQFIYWKYISGYTVYYSYGKQGFNWSDPQIVQGLFSASNGWLFYSPLMIFSLVGLLLYRSIRQWAWGLWVLVPLYTYVIYSWFAVYINGLGSRPMINIYPLLAIGLAAFIQYASRLHLVVKAFAFLVGGFFIAVNISYSMQEARGLLNSNESNYVFNFQTLFKWNLDYGDLVVKDIAEVQPDTAKLTEPVLLGFERYDDSASANYVRDEGGGFVYSIDQEDYNAGQITVYYDSARLKGARWLKGSGRFKITKKPQYYQHLFVIQVTRGDEVLLWKGCRIDNKIAAVSGDGKGIDFLTIITDKWGRVYFFVKVPEGIKHGDEIKLLVWNIGKLPLFLDDIMLEAYGEKG